MALLADSDVERVLVVVAHPDDIDFGVAGSVATWTDAGIDVQYCLVTSGDAGGHDESVSRTEMVEIRQREQTAAAKVVGVTELHWLGFPDGRVEPSLELRAAISRVIREVRPQRVVAMSPDRNYERVYASHPDHLATGEATMAAVYPDSRNPFAFPELRTPIFRSSRIIILERMTGTTRSSVWKCLTRSTTRALTDPTQT